MTVGNDEPTLRDMLRGAREAKGLSYADVEAATKISARVLRCLEEGNVSELPPPIYSKALMRRYAQFLGVDADKAVALMPDQPEPPLLPAATFVNGSSPFRIVNVLTGVVLVLAIVVITGWVYERAYVERPAPSPIAMPFDPPTEAEMLAAASGTASATIDALDTTILSRARGAPAGPRTGELDGSSSDGQLANGAGRPMTITIRAVEPTSVTVRVDDAEVFSGDLAYGETREFTGDREITVLSPNAGGVEILRNGQPIGLLGRPSEVSERTWTAAP